MKKLLYYLSFIILISCSVSPDDQVNIKTINDGLTENPLNSILGDKIIDLNTGKVRTNNFELLEDITVDALKNESKLYDILSIHENYYILKQKRFYTKARLFNIIFKEENNKITSFYILHDLSIKDLVINQDEIIILCDDWDNQNLFWKTSHQVQIIKLNNDFKEVWKYSIDNDHLLRAEDIIIRNKSIFYLIDIITGCHICYNIAKLELTNDGKFKSVIEFETHHSKSFDDEELIQILKVEPSPLFNFQN